MEPPQYGVDPLDYSTRLPPRKRLLASLKQKASPPELPVLTIHFNSTKLRARIQEFLDLGASFPEEGMELSKSVVLEAEEMAAAARAAAMEKATTAARARAFAKNVLEVVASLPKCAEHEDSGSSRVQGRQKQVAVQHLYDSKMSALACDDNEELARMLHHSINSSPRITGNSHVKNGKKTSRKDFVSACSKSSSLLCKVGGELHDEDQLDQNGVSTDSELMHFDAEVKAGRLCGKKGNEIKSTLLKSGKKVGIKRKKLPLSQFDSNNDNGRIVIDESKDRPASGKQKTGATSSLIKDGKPSSVVSVSIEKESISNCKKLKLSQIYSERKILHPLCSKTKLTVGSAVV